jgi:hypothetical protein
MAVETYVLSVYAKETICHIALCLADCVRY